MHDVIRDVCGRAEPTLKVGNWWRAVCVRPKTGPDDSGTPACFQTRCVWPNPKPVYFETDELWPNPDQATQIGSGSVLHNMIHAFFEKNGTKTDAGSRIWHYIRSGPILAVMATTGRNQNASGSDPACLLGCHTGWTEREKKRKKASAIPD